MILLDHKVAANSRGCWSLAFLPGFTDAACRTLQVKNLGVVGALHAGRLQRIDPFSLAGWLLLCGVRAAAGQNDLPSRSGRYPK